MLINNYSVQSQISSYLASKTLKIKIFVCFSQHLVQQSTNFPNPSEQHVLRWLLCHSCATSFHNWCSIQMQFHQCCFFEYSGYIHWSIPKHKSSTTVVHHLWVFPSTCNLSCGTRSFHHTKVSFTSFHTIWQQKSDHISLLFFGASINEAAC